MRFSLDLRRAATSSLSVDSFKETWPLRLRIDCYCLSTQSELSTREFALPQPKSPIKVWCPDLVQAAKALSGMETKYGWLRCAGGVGISGQRVFRLLRNSPVSWL